jgi:P-type Ca2+ transporter type 2C
VRRTGKPQLSSEQGLGPQPQFTPDEWARFSIGESMAALSTGPSGLGDEGAATRLMDDGPNAMPRIARRPWYVEFAANFIHLFALLLWAGAALAWVAGMPQLAWAIVAVIVINGCFSYWQEYQAERAVEALEALLPRHVTVRRGGRELAIPATDVVRGDLLVLTEGQAIPADARVVLSERLRVDASSLTGESRPTPRSSETAPTTDGVVESLPNLVFAGTSVASGRGEAVVFGTGAATEFGRIAQLTQSQRERPSPLEQELHRVTRVVTGLAVAFGMIFFVIGTSAGGLTKAAAFLFAVGIIVANVPEGLLPTLTLALALGVRRMARRNALVKRLSAVEALGAATVILTDKTGTLTENEMTVRQLWTLGGEYGLSGTGYDLDGKLEGLEASADGTDVVEVLRVAALCCDAHLAADLDGQPDPKSAPVNHRSSAIGDPTEVAIIVAAAKAGLSAASLATWPRLSELPFDSTRKRMTTIQRIDGAPIACVKGAPSELFPRCITVLRGGGVLPLEDDCRRAAQAAQDAMARRGMRVLAVARRQVDEPTGTDGWRVEDVERDLTLLGLVAMEDPPRREVPEAIAACRSAGVRPLMVTGDNGLTAAAIGREIGLHERAPRIVNGVELDGLDDEQLASLIENPDLLFARVSPEHKLRLVEAYQQRGEVVAVTGDGVNDAPALKRADIGIAMGETGTDVAREAADIILTDDNFASIIAAIEEGRGVYDNVRKFVTYIFASNIPELVPFIAFVLFRIPLPLTVMQILAVDLGTDLVPALALGAEAPESDVMRRSPRSRNDRLLNLPTLLRAYAWLGVVEAVLSLAGFFFAYWLAGWRPGETMVNNGPLYATATTMSLAGIVACQVGNLFACRSSRQSIFELGLGKNRLLVVGIVVEVGLLLALIYVPILATVFGLAPLRLEQWGLLVTFAPLVLFFEEVRKALIRSRSPQG